jgi:hypothetical protein
MSKNARNLYRTRKGDNMNSFNILSAIKVNAAALADTSYNEEAEPYIKALDGLFVDFTKTIRAEKTAESAPTETTAKQNNSNILSDNGGDLSSYHVGQKVHTPYGDGTILEINKEYGDPYQVEIDTYYCWLKESELTPF